ncbi:lipocalin-like domain-containing protein [Rhizobium jaguaris]|uniref:lipocalin-like domain-containing protein n=1 Tax=Rhizobium jaguaris TaxID=1312183 RepID=UPI0039BFDE47
MTSHLKENIVGGWELESYLETDIETGRSIEPYGPHAGGFILYTPDGYMSAQIQALNRRSFEKDDMFRGKPEEYVASASTYLAYSGRYRVDELGKRVIHNVAVSLFPNWVGLEQSRLAELRDDRLRLSFEKLIRFNGALKTATLTWRRLPS